MCACLHVLYRCTPYALVRTHASTSTHHTMSLQQRSRHICLHAHIRMTAHVRSTHASASIATAMHIGSVSSSRICTTRTQLLTCVRTRSKKHLCITQHRTPCRLLVCVLVRSRHTSTTMSLPRALIAKPTLRVRMLRRVTTDSRRVFWCVCVCARTPLHYARHSRSSSSNSTRRTTARTHSDA